MKLADSHCHLNLLELNDAESIDEVVTRAKDNNVHYLLNVCTAISEFENILNTANLYSTVWASVGLHPNDQTETVDVDTLVKLGNAKKVVAIGETGLDYFRSKGDLAWQQQRFRDHIDAAKALNKPLIIHTREAKDDTIRIMQEEKVESIGGVMHCFSEDLNIAKKALDLGFYISFSGIVTFKSAIKVQEVAKYIPLERMLIETDAPYLTPHPNRGKPNRPLFLRDTAKYLAELRNITLEEFSHQTTNNFFELFKGADSYV